MPSGPPRITIPASVEWIRSEPGGGQWLERLPALVDSARRRWGLRVGEPFEGGNVSWVAPARRGAGECVLKIQWPHRESAQEAAALEAWAGNGAVRLLDLDFADSALLIERCRPGLPVSSLDSDAAVDALAGLIAQLAIPTDVAFATVDDEGERWLRALRARRDVAPGQTSADSELLVEAIGLLEGLLAEDTEAPVLMSQDLHAGNALSASRSPWLAIDPKPLVGDLTLAAAPVIRSFELGHSRESVLGRLARVCELLGLDADRARRWAVAQTVAWLGDGVFAARHTETARWLAQA